MTATAAYEVRRVRDAREMAGVVELRHEVFCVEQGVPKREELDGRDAETRAAGGRRLVLHAQTYARALYEAAGYRPRGRAFTEAGIEHIAMEKQL
jgi:predicted GNAT family N-acyltransferase